jgi:hypothetical protein
MSSTGVKEQYLDYAIIYNSTSCLSDLNVSGLSNLNALNVSSNTILNNSVTIKSSLNVSGNTIINSNSTINSLLHINTLITEVNKAELSVDSSSAGILVNIKQNYGWIDNLNFAFNVDGYSNFGRVQINGQASNNIYKRMEDLKLGIGEINNIVLKTNSGYWETVRLNPYVVSINTLLYVTGLTTFNNNVSCLSSLNISGFKTLNKNTCLSSLNVSGITTISNNLTSSSLTVSGDSNLGPIFINNYLGPQNTFCLIGTTGNILQVNTSTYTRLGCSEDPKDTHILMYGGAGAYYMANYNKTGNTLHLFGDTTSNRYFKLHPLLNTSYNPLIVMGNATINSNLIVVGNIYDANLPNVSTFNRFL